MSEENKIISKQWFDRVYDEKDEDPNDNKPLFRKIILLPKTHKKPKGILRKILFGVFKNDVGLAKAMPYKIFSRNIGIVEVYGGKDPRKENKTPADYFEIDEYTEGSMDQMVAVLSFLASKDGATKCLTFNRPNMNLNCIESVSMGGRKMTPKECMRQAWNIYATDNEIQMKARGNAVAGITVADAAQAILAAAEAAANLNAEPRDPNIIDDANNEEDDPVEPADGGPGINVGDNEEDDPAEPGAGGLLQIDNGGGNMDDDDDGGAVLMDDGEDADVPPPVDDNVVPGAGGLLQINNGGGNLDGDGDDDGGAVLMDDGEDADVPPLVDDNVARPAEDLEAVVPVERHVKRKRTNNPAPLEALDINAGGNEGQDQHNGEPMADNLAVPPPPADTNMAPALFPPDPAMGRRLIGADLAAAAAMILPGDPFNFNPPAPPVPANVPPVPFPPMFLLGMAPNGADGAEVAAADMVLNGAVLAAAAAVPLPPFDFEFGDGHNDQGVVPAADDLDVLEGDGHNDEDDNGGQQGANDQGVVPAADDFDVLESPTKKIRHEARSPGRMDQELLFRIDVGPPPELQAQVERMDEDSVVSEDSGGHDAVRPGNTNVAPEARGPPPPLIGNNTSFQEEGEEPDPLIPTSPPPKTETRIMHTPEPIEMGPSLRRRPNARGAESAATPEITVTDTKKGSRSKAKVGRPYGQRGRLFVLLLTFFAAGSMFLMHSHGGGDSHGMGFSPGANEATAVPSKDASSLNLGQSNTTFGAGLEVSDSMLRGSPSTVAATTAPSISEPTINTGAPTKSPTAAPTEKPTTVPPTVSPTSGHVAPPKTNVPTDEPTRPQTIAPTKPPTAAPSVPPDHREYLTAAELAEFYGRPDVQSYVDEMNDMQPIVKRVNLEIMYADDYGSLRTKRLNTYKVLLWVPPSGDGQFFSSQFDLAKLWLAIDATEKEHKQQSKEMVEYFLSIDPTTRHLADYLRLHVTAADLVSAVNDILPYETQPLPIYWKEATEKLYESSEVKE